MSAMMANCLRENSSPKLIEAKAQDDADWRAIGRQWSSDWRSCNGYTAISIEVVRHEQSGKVEYERERLLGIANKLMNFQSYSHASLSRSYSTFLLCSWTTLIEMAAVYSTLAKTVSFYAERIQFRQYTTYKISRLSNIATLRRLKNRF
jgi:hypothetical protein